SDVNTRLGDIFPKATTFCTGLGAFGSAAVQSAFFIIVLFVKSPLKALIGCLAILVVAPVIRATHRYVRGMSFHIISDYESVQRSLVRASRNWMLIRVLKTESLELARLHESSLATTQKSLRVHFISGLSSALPEAIGILLIAVLLAAQYKLDPQPGSAFISFLYLFLRMVQSLGAAGSTLGSLQSNFAAYTQAADLIAKVHQRFIDKAMVPIRTLSLYGNSEGPNIEVKAKSNDPLSANRTSEGWPEPPTLIIENLGYRYPGSQSNVLDHLSLEVPAGSCIGIVGQSGAGKSTLLALVLGIIEPTQGSLWLKTGAQSFTPRNSAVPIGYVGAEPFLIAGTVQDNLLYGAQGVYEKEKLVIALINAGFAEDSYDWDQFLTSAISEDGEGLSTGQKQRLCLARALLAQPKLLVLDEVSANLDMHAEEKIAEHVQRLKGQCTVIIVSHRPGMLKACERLFDIQAQELRGVR
ncbi:MAG: ATP-binding cassette domain-containing protein, partial [Bdellovibrionia bacterium]